MYNYADDNTLSSMPQNPGHSQIHSTTRENHPAGLVWN